jgi:hypothetical protein
MFHQTKALVRKACVFLRVKSTVIGLSALPAGALQKSSADFKK